MADHPAEHERLSAVVETLLNQFYIPAGGIGEVDWRIALEGDELMLHVCRWGAPDAKIEAITYVDDGVTQVAPPRVFDPRRCATALDQALQKRGDRTDDDRPPG